MSTVGWQPIETAPGRGEGSFMELLLSDGETTYIGFWNGKDWSIADVTSTWAEFYPTHWAPVPVAPRSSTD